MKTAFIALCVGLLSVPAVAQTIGYTGSSTIGKFIADAAAVYGKVSFTMNTRPESAGGEQCAVEGLCDIGGVAREVDDRVLGWGVVKTLIGHDAIAAIVNSDNPVDEISTAALHDIFAGRLTNWNLLGGPDLPVTAYVVGEGSATRQVFQTAVMHGDEYTGVTVVEPDARMLTVVGSGTGTVGQISMSFLKYDRPGVKSLDVDGHPAGTEDPDYPLTRPLYLLTHGDPKGQVKAFIDWVLGAEGQAVVRNRFVGIQ